MKRALPFLPAAAYYGLIFFLSSKPLTVDIEFPLIDKAIHMAEFGILGFLLLFGFSRSLKYPPHIKFILALVTGILLGILDEVHQYFIPTRESDVLDFLADVVGIVLGAILFWQISRKKLKKVLPSEGRGKVI